MLKEILNNYLFLKRNFGPCCGVKVAPSYLWCQGSPDFFSQIGMFVALPWIAPLSPHHGLDPGQEAGLNSLRDITNLGLDTGLAQG